jgi:hypothetical protein
MQGGTDIGRYLPYSFSRTVPGTFHHLFYLRLFHLGRFFRLSRGVSIRNFGENPVHFAFEPQSRMVSELHDRSLGLFRAQSWSHKWFSE